PTMTNPTVTEDNRSSGRFFNRPISPWWSLKPRIRLRASAEADPALNLGSVTATAAIARKLRESKSIAVGALATPIREPARSGPTTYATSQLTDNRALAL